MEITNPNPSQIISLEIYPKREVNAQVRIQY